MTQLTALPPNVRAIIYWATFAVGLILGGLQVWYLTTSSAQPVWLTGALAVASFLSAGFGAVAASNTTLRAAEPEG